MVDVQIRHGGLGVADAGPQTGHPRKAVAAPPLRAQLVVAPAGGGDDLAVGRRAVDAEQSERMDRHRMGEMAMGFREVFAGGQHQAGVCGSTARWPSPPAQPATGPRRSGLPKASAISAKPPNKAAMQS